VHHWLALSEPSETQLEYMQRALADTDSPALWRKVMMAEAGSNYSVLLRWQEEPALLDKAFNFIYPSGKWWDDPLAWARAYNTIQQLRSPWQYAAFMQSMLDAYHQTGQPLSEQKRWFKEHSEKNRVDRPKEIHSLISYLAPALDKVLRARLKLLAHTRCAQIALAAERFRRANQRWPTSQAELVGTYLTVVLLDPFDDQPIRYKLLPDGVVIYSIVGISPKDDIDDGGDVLNHDNETRDRPKDLGIRLWEVAQRRQPARFKP